MKILTVMLATSTMVGCAPIAPPSPSDLVATRCQNIEAPTGTNHLTRRACQLPDPRDTDEAQAALEALQRDQIQRALPRPGSPGAQ